MKFLGIVVCFLCVNLLDASMTYKAAVFSNKEIKFDDYVSMVAEAGKSNVDIVVLPPLASSKYADNYDEIVKTLSTAAADSNLYLVASLYEKSLCHDKIEVIRSNLVFDREGHIISVYRKPDSNQVNCTSTSSELDTFTTDFGVTFGVLMAEDIVIHNMEYMKGLKNFVMTGASNIGLLSANSWSYVNNVNLITSDGIFAGQSYLKTDFEGLLIAELVKSGNIERLVPSINDEDFCSEDFKQYIIKPLDLEASVQGYTETVCYNEFCCEFYAKASAIGQNPESIESSYALAVFDGIHQQNIGVQSCMLLACTNQHKKCKLLPNKSTNVIFEKISVTANFTEQTAQYPIIQSTSVLPTNKIQFYTTNNGVFNQVTLEIVDSQSILKFGLFGRDYTKDFEGMILKRNISKGKLEIYSYDIFLEDVQEFFDYVWIRLRILLVVVSIYVLEMM